MDGNGRWAELKGHSRIFGHVKGAKVAKSIIEECVKRKVDYLTLFAFSTENWQRPQFEVSFLMRLLRKYLIRERKSLCEQNIRFTCIGEISRLPASAQEEVRKTIEATQHNTGLNLVFALSYGGRQEILNAAKALCQKVKEGTVDINNINDDLFKAQMESAYLPDPDLIIRTSGENRVSNFFLWQSAYSEFYFCQSLWPDFTVKQFEDALDFYNRKERRFGKTGGQIRGDAPYENVLPLGIT